MRRTIAMFAALIAAPVLHAEPPRAELPIREVILSDGARRYAVPITIGGVTIDAGLDTGSTGLRVLPRAFAQPPKKRGGTHYQYSSGVTLDGGTAEVPLAFGTVASDRVAVHAIDAIGCTRLHPDCAGTRLTLADFGIQGDGLKGEGFAAILGLNMADDAVPNPLIAMGVTRWIVELPLPGSGSPGRLILDPTDAEAAGYRRIAIIHALAGAHGGVHDAVPGCLLRTDTMAKLCGPVLFDSGAPGLRVSLPGFREPWPQGTPGQLILGEGKDPAAIGFAVGRREQGSAMMAEAIPAGAAPHISAGLMPYFAWSVLYDAKAGVIGVKPR